MTLNDRRLNLDVGIATQSSASICHDSADAMASWIRDGTVSMDYIRKTLGDQTQAVIVRPASNSDRKRT